MKDDFETRSKYVASNELEFVNSWKENPLCGDVYFVVDPCSKNPYRKAWAEKTCSIINSQVFSACHNKVRIDLAFFLFIGIIYILPKKSSHSNTLFSLPQNILIQYIYKMYYSPHLH